MPAGKWAFDQWLLGHYSSSEVMLCIEVAGVVLCWSKNMISSASNSGQPYFDNYALQGSKIKSVS